MPEERKDGEAAIGTDAIEELFWRRYVEGSEHLGEYHETMFKEKRFAAGHQWDDKDRDRADEIGFPILQLDQTGGVIRAIASSEITTRHEHKYFGRNEEDHLLAETANKASRYIRQQAGAEFVDSDAFRDMVTCGMGVTEWYFDETIGDSGSLQEVRHPIEDFLWDPAASKKNIEDATWIIRGKWITLDEFNALFPEDSVPEVASGSPDMSMFRRGSKNVTYPIDYTGAEPKSKGFYRSDKDSVLMFEMQDYYTEAEYTVVDEETGEEHTLDKEAYDKLRKIYRESEMGRPIADMRARRVYRRSIFAGNKLVKTEELPTNGFTYLFMTCFEEPKEEGMFWFGMTRLLMDPQRVANVAYSQVFHILGTNPKGAILYEEDAFENVEEFEQNWARSDGTIKMRPGAVSERKYEVVKANYPSEFERLMTVSLNAVPRIAGVDPYFMGQTGGDLRRVSGTALSQITQQGQMMLSIPFDSLRKFRQDTGRLLLDLMKVYLPDEQVMRVVGDTSSGPSPEFFMFKKGDLKDVLFDIVVGEAPITKTAMHEFWNSLAQHGNIPALVELGVLTGKTIAKILPDVPEDERQEMIANAEKREQMMMQAAQQQPPQN